jgi:hypothetical protein
MSSTSSIPLWGQAWSLTVYYATADGGSDYVTIESTAWEPLSLRVTFDVLQAMNKTPFWDATINIYNLGSDTALNLYLNATWATLSAGFQTGPNKYSVIWNGPVFQTLFTRENVVDQKLTLYCVAFPNTANFLPQSFSVGTFFSQQQLVAQMIVNANLPALGTGGGVVTQGKVAAQRMNAVQYPRGNTVFGTLPAYLSQMAGSNGLQTWFDGNAAYISEVDTGLRTPNYIYAPPYPPGGDQETPVPAGTTQSIIGTPEQTQEGVNFNLLLDPRIGVQLPPLLVQLVRTQITQLQRTPYVGSSPITTLATPDAANLMFFVTQVRHVGDTRGNDWRTEVTGWSTAYAQQLLASFGVT